jgi:tetrahydromethanopterin S-methyltransferase subunit G
MGAIEDTRKVLQDFLAPEIREIKARLDALENRMEDRFNAAERLAHQRHDAIISEIRGLSNYNEIRDRLTKLEAAKEALHQ